MKKKILMLTGLLIILKFFIFAEENIKREQAEIFEKVLTLKEAIDLAINNNPEISIARHEQMAVKNKEKQAQATLMPRIAFYADYTNYKDSQRLIQARYNGEPGVFSHDIISAGITGQIPVFDRGRIKNDMLYFRDLSESARYRFERIKQEVCVSAASVFYSILAQQNYIESLRFSLKTMQEHLTRTKKLIEAQKAARVDALRVEVRVADIRERLVREENKLVILYQTLCRLIGLKDVREKLKLQGQLEKEIADLPKIEDMISKALKQRPDYQSIAMELESQEKRVRSVKSELSPTINLQAVYGYKWAINPISDSRGENQQDNASIRLTIDLPVFDGGRIRARIREEEEKLAVINERLRKLELQINLEVQSAISNIISSRERLITMEKIIEQARESLKIERQKYDMEKGTIIDVLDAQSALLEAETGYFRALVDFNISRLQLYLATGENVL
ncbi:MAG: TolC family protein [Candidatus Omnitrophica bacterium]|nr:TolC family protein [Candidatus Omnitrophota bacterium]